MDNDRTKDLELRIKKLEDELASVRSRPQVSELTAEDIQAFRKVRDAIAWDPEGTCGINECQQCIVLRCDVRPCIVNPCINPCINECICGPCNICRMGGGGFGGGGRFGGLGG